MSALAAWARLPQRAVRRWSFQHAQHRLVEAMDHLTRTASPAPSDGPRIGVATFGSGGWHLALEALLAHALQLRGARSELLVCDLPELPICDERTAWSRSPDRCAGCLDDKRALLDACRLPWRGLRAYLDDDAVARAVATASAVPDARIDDYCERGWPVGRWLHVSASHYLRADARGDTAEQVAVRRRWLASAIVTVQAVERWLDETRPDVIVAESGAHVMWRVAFELARARGLDVMCREIGKGGFDHHLYALNADCMAPDLDAAWAEYAGAPLSAVEEREVDRFVAELPARTYPASRGTARHEDLRAALGLDAARPVAVAFTNVTWDLATAGRDAGFGGGREWIEGVVRAAARHPGVQVIVRAHPAEAHVATRERVLDDLAAEWPALPANVTTIAPEDPVPARDLLALADLALVYNSTAGLEAAMAGVPVLVAGAPHFRGKGFTIDIDSPAHLAAAFDAWAAAGGPAAPPAARDLARRYCHLFFLRYHLRMGWTTSPLAPPIALTVRALDELAPGRNASVDLVCAAILERRQPLLPRPRPDEVPCAR